VAITLEASCEKKAGQVSREKTVRGVVKGFFLMFKGKGVTSGGGGGEIRD